LQTQKLLVILPVLRLYLSSKYSNCWIDSVSTDCSANASVIDAGTLTAARLPAGSVLQVVQSTTTTSATTSSTSYVDTGFSASITPTSASSKILIIGSAVIRVGISNTNYQHTIFRNGSVNLRHMLAGFIQCRDRWGKFIRHDSSICFLRFTSNNKCHHIQLVSPKRSRYKLYICC
jgi:hypothetical protein